MNIVDLCPFSKPILGKWCQCSHARMAERCSGKMICSQAQEFRDSCMKLDELLKTNSRFISGQSSQQVELTHAQLMKIRCGGLAAMQKVLGLNSADPLDILDVIESTQQQFNDLAEFPYNEIVRDIKEFKHR